jgi:transposase
MAKATVEEKCPTKEDEWRERMAEQARSGLSIKQFCKERGVTPWSFYDWRKRLREPGAVRFALVERGPAERERATEAHLELILPGGVRMHIRSGVDGATLRTVLEALRG